MIADPPGQPEPLQPGRGEQDRVVVAAVELGEARLDVAAQRGELQARVARRDLRGAAQAGGAHARPRRQRAERGVAVGDEGVARVLALEDRGQHETGRQPGGHVLHRVHGQFGAPVGHRLLELLHEQALAG